MANKLAQWLNAEPKPMAKSDFAEKIGVTPGYVSQLCSDSPPWPGREIAKRIGEVTEGRVTPNDLAGYVEESAA
jgi:3,4-dihydroxy 2-butanone 4-phosphate synthase/GTP cyclohydrolase II